MTGKGMAPHNQDDCQIFEDDIDYGRESINLSVSRTVGENLWSLPGIDKCC